jgi:hypothetical protein
MPALRRTALALIASLSALAAHAAEPFSFGVLGDTPYNRFERTHLPAVIAEMDAELLKVVIHDGDIKNGGSAATMPFTRTGWPCSGAVTILLFVPGDNDWTDCHRTSNGPTTPGAPGNAARGVLCRPPQNPRPVPDGSGKPGR